MVIIFTLVTKVTTSGVYYCYLLHQSYPVSKLLKRKRHLPHSFWDVAQLMLVVVYMCFGKAYRFHLQASGSPYYQLKCDGTSAETRIRLSAKRTSPFKSAGASVQSTTGSRGVRISGSNAEYTMFRGSVKGTGYPLHLSVSPSLPLPCVTECHHVSSGV